MNRRLAPFTLQQAVEQSPTLASLAAMTRDTNERLKALESLIPVELRDAIQAGPVGEHDWCLLVRGSAAAAKLRQLLPTLQTRLKARGWEISTIRIKVQTSRGGHQDRY